MPDLETAAVRDWLQEHENEAVGVSATVFRPVEENPDVLAALQRCGSALDRALGVDGAALSRSLCSEPYGRELRQIMAQLGTARTVRLIGWIAKEGMPEATAVMASLFNADPTGSGQFLLASMAEAARPVLLSRLFGPERLSDLLAACTQVSQLKEAA